MTKSTVEGVEGDFAEISVENSQGIQKLEAVSLRAHRMPEAEKQPDFKWLIEITLPDVTDELQKTLVDTSLIVCEAETISGWCKYAFIGTNFIGSLNGTVKFGAAIISQSVKLRALR